MMPRRRLGWFAVVLGLVAVAAVQVAVPVGVPLYDGVVVIEPYRFLHPVSGQRGDPTTFTSTPAVVNGVSPIFAAATTESPPQAQLIAAKDAFMVPTNITSLNVSITPIEPESSPTEGVIAGNTYAFRVTDGNGTPLVPKPCDNCLTIVLRAPEGTEGGVIGQLVNGEWKAVETLHAGVAAMYQTNPASLGDFAIVTGSSPGEGIDLTLILAGLGIALIFAAFVGLMFIRARPPAAYPTGSGRGGSRARIPSKRRGPPRPPGRSE